MSNKNYKFCPDRKNAMDIKQRLINKINTLSDNELQDLLAMVDEKRQCPRTPYIMEVEYEVEGQIYTDFLLDVSEGGLFVEAATSFPLGTPVLFRFELRDLKDPFLVDGTIVWQSRHGFGAQFCQTNDHQRRIIAELIRSIK